LAEGYLEFFLNQELFSELEKKEKGDQQNKNQETKL